MKHSARFSVTTLISLLLLGVFFASCKKECPFSSNTAFNAIAINAGKSQIILVSGDTATLTGFVLNGKSTINSYSWTAISGPNVPLIKNSDSLSALATGLTIGTYTFQLRASSANNIGFDTTSVLVAKHLIFRIDSGNKEMNFVLYNGSDVSGPLAPEMFPGWWTSSGNPYDSKSIFQFDLSALPVNATILAAKLTLYSDSTPINGDHLGDANSGINNAFYIERVTSSWNYSNTWFTIPSTDTAGQILMPTTILPQLDITDLDVTNMVNNMRNNNYGFELRMQSEVAYTTRIFCSGLYNEASRHPKLEIFYK